jgi:PAS domain S-box-containing protein
MLGDRAPFLFFLLTIVVVKRLWGRGSALLTTLLGGLAAWYFILTPRFSFVLANHVDALNLAAYFVIGAGISYLGEVSGRSLVARAVGRGSTKLRIIRQTVVLAGAAVILAGMVLLLLRDFARAQEAEGWVVHTYRVINSAETLLSTLKDAETGERGYLLTGDEHYLAPYNAAISAIPRGLEELKNLTFDNPAQQARWTEINRLAGERLRVLKHAIELHNVAGGATSLDQVRFGRGEPAMDELRSTLDAMVAEERRLLVERTAEAEVRASRGRWVLGLGSGALVLLLVFASVVIERETVRREEITQALRRHADLLDQTHDSLLTCRLGGAIEYWSRGAETLYGYGREEALGQISHELLHTDHPRGIAQIYSQLERDGEWKGELTQTTKDGRKLAVEGQWTLAADTEGHKMVLEANRDITERKRAEAENLLLATAIEQAAETVVVTDREGRIQYANPAFSRSTGYTHDEALGQNPRILKSGRHDAKFYQELWATLTAGKLWHGEFTNRRKDGTLYVEEATLAPVRNASGEIANYVAIKYDITSRKRAELALEESELRYRQLFERSESALAVYEMILDPQGNPRDFRYLNVNPAFERITGRIASQILGRTAREITPEIEDYWIELFGRVAATGEPATFEHFAKHLGRYYSGSAYTPRAHQVAVTFMDVTERKQAEEQLHVLNLELEQRVRQRTVALEMANRELEAFAHSVSHDLRAPLRGIDGWSLALLEDCGERLDAQGKVYLDRVRSEAQHMGRLIDDLLNLSRVTRGEMVAGTVDLSLLAETVAARLKEGHRDRAIEFTVSPELKCTGDARLLEVALTNLFDNSVKFSAPSPTARVEFGQTEREGNTCFYVRDNGVGFDMAYARMLFAPFQRLHKTSEFPGTGIGLATVQRVIHRHGGRIWAEAQVGKGATFYFTLGENKA